MLSSLLYVVAIFAHDAAAPSIEGPAEVKEHALVRVVAANVPPKAGVIWRVTPATVDRATTPRGRLEFAAAPGEYTVELLVIEQQPDGSLAITEVSKKVRVGQSPPVVVPPPKSAADPVKATVKYRHGTSGCTATVVGPRRADGKWDVLCAAHCCDAVGDKGTIQLKDGRVLGVTVGVRKPHPGGPDIAWMTTDRDDLSDLPYAELAGTIPGARTPVWHVGYGIDVPTNREDGEVLGESGDGQLSFNLSVSPGDSGSGIFRADTGELVGVVCCTRTLAKKTTMWGGSSVTAISLRPKN